MAVVCTCGRSFSNDTAIALHQKACPRAASSFSDLLKRKREADERRRLRKRQNRDNIAVEAAVQEPLYDTEIPPDIEVHCLYSRTVQS